MTKQQKNESRLVVTASVWLKDEESFAVVENLDHTPRPGEEFVIDRELWRIAEVSDRGAEVGTAELRRAIFTPN